MEATTENIRSTGLDVLPVEHVSEYVIGLPVYVAITVRAHTDTAFNQLLFANFTDLRESIGIEMQNETGADMVRAIPKPVIEPEAGIFPQRLAPGESRRMLADVSPLIGSQISEGSYRATFFFVSPSTILRAAPVTLHFRKMTAAEEHFRSDVASDRPTFPNWAMWSTTCPTTPASPANIKDAGPLTFPLLLRHLLCGPEPLRQIDPATVDALTGLYSPEAAALKAELYQLRGNDADYQAIRAQALAKTPGLAWWFRMIDNGGAFLKSLSRRPQ